VVNLWTEKEATRGGEFLASVGNIAVECDYLEPFLPRELRHLCY
jgi:hypothetical protein